MVVSKKCMMRWHYFDQTWIGDDAINLECVSGRVHLDNL